MANLSSNGVLDRGWQNVSANFSDVASMANVAKGYMDNVNNIVDKYFTREAEQEKALLERMKFFEDIRQSNIGNQIEREKLANQAELERMRQEGENARQEATQKNAWDVLAHQEQREREKAQAQNWAMQVISGQARRNVQEQERMEKANDEGYQNAISTVDSLTKQNTAYARNILDIDSKIKELNSLKTKEYDEFSKFKEDLYKYRDALNDRAINVYTDESIMPNNTEALAKQRTDLQARAQRFGFKKDVTNFNSFFGWNNNELNRIDKELQSRPPDPEVSRAIQNLTNQRQVIENTLTQGRQQEEQAKRNLKALDDNYTTRYKSLYASVDPGMDLVQNADGSVSEVPNFYKQSMTVRQILNQAGFDSDNDKSMPFLMFGQGNALAQAGVKANADFQAKAGLELYKQNLQQQSKSPAELSGAKFTTQEHADLFNNTLGALYNALDRLGIKYDKQNLARVAIPAFTSEEIFGDNRRYKQWYRGDIKTLPGDSGGISKGEAENLIYLLQNIGSKEELIRFLQISGIPESLRTAVVSSIQ